MDSLSSQSSATGRNPHISGVITPNGISSYTLIRKLMVGALEKVVLARQYMLSQDKALKASHISWSISIIEGLRLCLNKDSGNEIATNLDILYQYMIQRLVKANADNSADALDEVAELLSQIESAWEAVPGLLNKNTGATKDVSTC